MIGEWDARLIAAQVVCQPDPMGRIPGMGMREFDLGYVFWQVPLPGTRSEVGGARVVVDRRYGELTYWPSVPSGEVIEQYRHFRDRNPVSPLTWDPVARARYHRRRPPFPTRVTHLTLADGRLRIGHTMRGDGTPQPHQLVGEFLSGLLSTERDRGWDRCSEVAVFSDLCYVEDARLQLVGGPALTLEVVRDQLLRGAGLVTYRISDPDDPLGGQSVPPCLSCRHLIEHFGFNLLPPRGEDASDTTGSDDRGESS